jgi:CelD/BcsL family acetyltransferase involved in cellulose biosynthesis
MHDRRPARGKHRAEILDTAGLRALEAAEWNGLSRSALIENPFYSRQYVLAGLDTIDRATRLRAVAIRNERRQLVGLFPFRSRVFPPFPWPVARGAQNLYQFSGTPLIARQGAQATVNAWLDTVRSGASPPFWTMGHVNACGPIKTAIDAGAAERKLATRTVVSYPRPHLADFHGGFDAYANDVIAKSRLKDIQRNLRRLRGMGEVAFERATEPALVRERLEQFLAMEQAGWKGRAGTAFLSKDKHAAFARKAFEGREGTTGLTIIDSLLLDGRPIAMSLNIAARRTAFTPKCTYDETLRKLGPGLILEYLIIERFFNANEFDDMDAATTTDGHVVLGLWNRQKQMARLIVGPDDWRTDLFAKGWSAAYGGKQRLLKTLRC